MESLDTGKLIIQLRALLQLTHTETQIAETRRAQARTDEVRRELTQNADNARARSSEIGALLRKLGGVPDVVSPLVGRVTAMVKTIAEQVEPLDGALLDDLALERQLFDRARYLKVLATAAGNAEARDLAERLETAHGATVDWLSTVLAEEALGGPTALRRTPLQAAVGGAGRLVNLPVKWSSGQVDRVVDSLKRTRGRVSEIGDYYSATFKDVASESLSAGLGRAEAVSRRDGATTTASAVHRFRASTGTLFSDELPIEDYADLNQTDVVATVKTLSDPDEIRAVLAYEERHKNRGRVISATQTRLASVAKEIAGITQ